MGQPSMTDVQWPLCGLDGLASEGEDELLVRERTLCPHRTLSVICVSAGSLPLSPTTWLLQAKDCLSLTLGLSILGLVVSA